MVHPKAIPIRAKKLAIMLQDARTIAGKTKTETADVLGISPSTYSSYEEAIKSPSLPELETLSYFFGIPIEHFWGGKVLSENPLHEQYDFRKLMRLRDQIIGVMLRQARNEANLTLSDLGERLDISSSQLSDYELGRRPIPLPELEAIINTLEKPIQEFYNNKGPLGEWASKQRAIKQFEELPPELQDFVCKPINQPYLEIAQRLSEMSVDKLRAVAEGLLEITL